MMKLAQRIMELAESATLAVASKAAKMKSQGIDVVGFGAGEPDFSTPDHIKQACIKAIQDGHTGYSKPASGMLTAKQAVCEKLSRENDLTYAPEQVIITAGGKMTVYLAFHSIIDPGDEVILPKPYWVSYPEIIKLADGVPVYVQGLEENDYKLTPDQLVSAITDRTRAVLINSPSNPSGVTYAPEEIRALAEVLQDRDLTVISDEIYDRLLYGGQQTMSSTDRQGIAHHQRQAGTGRDCTHGADSSQRQPAGQGHDRRRRLNASWRRDRVDQAFLHQ